MPLTLIKKVQGKFSADIAKATKEVFEMEPALPLKTMTNDNGIEFCGFTKLEKVLDAPIYFTHPYCSWERGTNENTNGLIREFFPKGSSMAQISDQEVQAVEDRLNTRPRKSLHEGLSLSVDPLGPLAFSITARTAKALIVEAEPAKFGKGSETILDLQKICHLSGVPEAHVSN